MITATKLQQETVFPITEECNMPWMEILRPVMTPKPNRPVFKGADFDVVEFLICEDDTKEKVYVQAYHLMEDSLICKTLLIDKSNLIDHLLNVYAEAVRDESDTNGEHLQFIAKINPANAALCYEENRHWVVKDYLMNSNDWKDIGT